MKKKGVGIFLVLGIIVFVIIFSYTHNEKNIFYRTRFTYAGKTMTIDEVRNKSYGFYNGKSKDKVFALNQKDQELFAEKIIGENKKKEKQIIEATQPFYQIDLSGGQYWVSKQAGIFTPTFYYYELYEYKGDCYIRMKFAINKKRKSYSASFKFRDKTPKEIKEMIKEN